MRQNIICFICAAFLMAFITPCNDASRQQDTAGSTAENSRQQEILVKFKSSTPEDSISTLASAEGLVHIRSLKGIGVRVYRVPSDKSIEDVIKKIQADPNVEYAEPNLEYRIPEKQQ